jgi:mRNA-decapping enzyme subunit 2
LAEPGEEDGWKEADMFKANELLLGRKVTYNGSPHYFSEKGFDGMDPHAFHVVGGGFMNSGVGIGSLAPPPEKSRLQPLFRMEGSEAEYDDDHSGLQPFFGESSPWTEIATASLLPEVPPKQNKVQNAKTDNKVSKENAGKVLLSMLQKSSQRLEMPPVLEASDGFSVFLTDAEVTARSQKVKVTGTSVNDRLNQMRLLRLESQKRRAQNRQEIDAWVQNLPQAPPTEDFGDFRLDTASIIRAMEAAMIKA